jgi:amino acid transporter
VAKEGDVSSADVDPQGSEEQVVIGFGYRQELRRGLRAFSVFSVAFSIISITTGIFLNFAFGVTELGPVSIWLWPIAGVGQLLVALVLSELATRIPLAGANYQWGARLVNPTYGWFVGALGVMYGAVGLPGIMFLAAAPLTEYVFNVSAPSARLTLFIALLLITVAYLTNVISVQVAARVNNVAVFTEIVGTTLLAIVLFILWVAKHKARHGGGILGNASHLPGQPYWYAIVLASLLGVYTIVGFESAADMSEEALDARRSVPKAMINSVLLSTVLGMIALIGFTLALPPGDPRTFIGTNGLPGEFQYWLGAGLARTFVAIVVFSMFALCVIGAASNARLIYAMARDNMLPWSSGIKKVNPSTKTPIVSLTVSWLICIGVMIFGYNSSNAFGTMVGATALVPYIVYLLTVVAYGWKRRGLEALPGAFHLGKWAGPVFGASLVWLVAVVLALSLPSEFHDADKYVAGGLVLAFLWWIAVLARRFANHTAGPDKIPDQPHGELATAGSESGG